MSRNSTLLNELYQQAKAKRVVLNKEEFAIALDYSRGHLHRLMKGEDEVSDDLIIKATELSNGTNNVTKKADHKDRLNVIEAKMDVLLKEFVTLKSPDVETTGSYQN